MAAGSLIVTADDDPLVEHGLGPEPGRFGHSFGPARPSVRAGTIYPRSTARDIADGVGEPVEGPNERLLSNRIFNDTHQNVFLENGVTHWAFVWGQFIDHTIGLRASSDDP
ncbi:MAG: peroxidase family protein [Ilumatobacteraceae bacterium]